MKKKDAFKKMMKSRKMKHLIINVLNVFYLAIILNFVYIYIRPYVFDVKNDFFIDVGSEQNNKTKGIDAIGPKDRVSDTRQGVPTYRELINQAVYTSISIPVNAKKMEFSIRFKNHFPPQSDGLFVGVQNEAMGYNYKPIYIPRFKKPQNVINITDGFLSLYFLKNNLKKILSIKEFLDDIPKCSLIATNISVIQKDFIIKNYTPSNLEITTALRGSHSFFTYAAKSLELSILKQDLNSYEGGDVLTIMIYDKNNKLIKEAKIEDDGISDRSRRTTEPQAVTIVIPNITEGVFRIDMMSNSDMIIRKIQINQNKFIAIGRVFIALDEANKIPAKLYFESCGTTNVQISTLHKETFQTVVVGKNMINISEVNKKYNVYVEKSFDLIEVKSVLKNIILTSNGYFSFTRNSYFSPSSYQTTDINNLEKADYLLTDYKQPERDGEWMIGATVFDLEKLNTKNKKMSIILKTSHLGDSKYNNYSIPIDWIKASVYSSPRITRVAP